MSPVAPFFTVLTPTFNRAHTLCRVHHSLLKQTFRDFEWIIVDDGSIDGTRELVGGWIEEDLLAIRYLWQPNSGKHVAFNHGVREATGAMVVPLDSDDECVPMALERFRHHWLLISEPERHRFCSVMCLCRDEKGDVLGGPLARDVIDGRSFEVLSRLRRNAEMWVALRTDVLRDHPFPEYRGECFVPEGLVWNRIGRSYLTRFVNEALRVYHDSPESLSRSSLQIRLSSPCGTLDYYREMLDLRVRFSLRWRAAANLWRFSLGCRRLRAAVTATASYPFLAALGVLPGAMLWLRDLIALRAQRITTSRRRVPVCRG